MRIVIVEDEPLAAEKLERYLKKWNDQVKIVAHKTSIKEAVAWFEDNIAAYDLVFFDIQLSDGLSFEIFKKVNIETPVIFTTAFDEFALDAFKVNSIDYILKPVTFTEISNAMGKWKQMKSILNNSQVAQKIEQDYHSKKHKDRFLVKMGNHIHSIKTSDIGLFYAEGRTVFLVTRTEKKYIVDFRLEDLVQVLSSKQFFRTNRTYVVNLNAIEDVLVYSNSRLKVKLTIPFDKDILVSRDRVADFKNWFEGNS